MKYFVSSDIHGFYSEWIKALEEKQFNIEDPEHKLIVLGDLFDRGSEAKALQTFVMDLIERDKIILIKGNHEDLLVSMLNSWHRESYLEVHHNSNGTVDTVLQLTDSKLTDLYNYPSEVYYKMKETPFIKKILPAMVDYFETESHVFVHGWIPCYTLGERRRVEKFFYNEKWREASSDEWKLARWYNGMDAYRDGVIEKNKTIVCGHWHTSYGHSKYERKCSEFGYDADFSPYFDNGIIALDACTAHSKKINCIVIEK
jgi:serine/threonine protein phosphatase 1